MSQILIVDDEQSILTTLSILLTNQGYDVDTADSLLRAKVQMDENIYDLIVTDMRLGDGDGKDLLAYSETFHFKAEVVVITAHGSIESAVGAIKQGAYDYIIKPVDSDKLIITIEKALEHKKLKTEIKSLRQEFRRNFNFSNILLGKSEKIKHVFNIVSRIAETDVSVLLEGENGTGKNVVARAIHNASRRSEKPFITINCSGLNEHLLDSELFGHIKGAFTGAIANRKGHFEEAHGGTLFLDEVGTMPLSIQARLLNVLQEKTFARVGSNKPILTDTRIISASNKKLLELVKKGEFREDLYYRLRVVEIDLPPLKERHDDILPLSQGFLKRFAELMGKNVTTISPDAVSSLLTYAWPGNVRELENCIESAVALCGSNEIEVADLPCAIKSDGDDISVYAMRSGFTLEELEKKYIYETLKANGWKQKKTAKILDIGRNTLWRKIKRYGIEVPPSVHAEVD